MQVKATTSGFLGLRNSHSVNTLIVFLHTFID